MQHVVEEPPPDPLGETVVLDHSRGQELLVKEALHIDDTHRLALQTKDWKSLLAEPQ